MWEQNLCKWETARQIGAKGGWHVRNVPCWLEMSTGS